MYKRIITFYKMRELLSVAVVFYNYTTSLTCRRLLLVVYIEDVVRD